MSNYAKLLQTILQGHSVANIPFAELCQLLLCLGFTEHIRGSHHLFRRHSWESIIGCRDSSGVGIVSRVLNQVERPTGLRLYSE